MTKKNRTFPPPEREIDGKSYPVHALAKAANDAGFVSAFAGQLLNKYLEASGGELPVDQKERSNVMDACFAHAEEWRLKMKAFEQRRLEDITKQMTESMPLGHNGSRIIIPDAATMQDHLPPGAIPHMGR